MSSSSIWLTATNQEELDYLIERCTSAEEDNQSFQIMMDIKFGSMLIPAVIDGINRIPHNIRLHFYIRENSVVRVQCPCDIEALNKSLLDIYSTKVNIGVFNDATVKLHQGKNSVFTYDNANIILDSKEVQNVIVLSNNSVLKGNLSLKSDLFLCKSNDISRVNLIEKIKIKAKAKFRR